MNYLDDIDTWVSADMARHAQAYIDYCTDLKGMAQRVWIEEKVAMPTYVKNGFGTVDFAALIDDTLHVVDLKYGKGVMVFANTTQAKYYAVCLIDTYKLDPALIAVTIHQPRLHHVDTEIFTRAEILEAAELFKKGAKRVKKMDAILIHGKKGEATFKVGSHCGFCRAKLRCKAMYNYVTKSGPLTLEGFTMTKDQPVGTKKDEWARKQVGLLDDEDLADYFTWCDLATRTANAIKAEATTRAAKGLKLPGLKLVAGRKSYNWKNQATAEVMLKDHCELSEDDCYNKSFLTVAQAEKKSGKALKSHVLVEASEGKATLVSEKDRRKAINPADAEDSAREGFA